MTACYLILIYSGRRYNKNFSDWRNWGLMKKAYLVKYELNHHESCLQAHVWTGKEL